MKRSFPGAGSGVKIAGQAPAQEATPAAATGKEDAATGKEDAEMTAAEPAAAAAKDDDYDDDDDDDDDDEVRLLSLALVLMVWPRLTFAPAVFCAWCWWSGHLTH